MNARYLADAGAAVVIPDGELTPSACAPRSSAAGGSATLEAMGRAALGLARPMRRR